MKPLKFQPNTPVEIALLYPAGKTVETPFGLRVMVSLVGGQKAFLDLSTALKITKLGIRPYQRFFICRYKEKRGALDHWQVWLPGQQPTPPRFSFAALTDSAGVICQ